MGLERQVIAACGSAVCGDDLAMEVPVRGPAAAPVEASVVATSNRKRRAPSCPPGRPPESGSAALVRHAAAGFLMGLVGFAALLALPLQAQAQTTVWSATLTPRTTFSGTPVSLGCDNTSTGNRRCSNSNTLSDDFTDDGTTYAVTKFFTRNGVLTFRLDTGATAATQGLTLVIDGEEFVLKEADQINGAKTQWKWNSTTLGWTAGTDVAVSLVATDAPATGQPTISGGGQVGKTLTAATDDIEDVDGLPTTPTFTYQWVRVDGSTDTDIPGAASETYTLTASDLGKQIKVTVSFTDLRGHAEGPLTSDAYPRNGTVTVVVLPGPCPAVNDWCATMTVADDGTGFGYEFDKSGSLDDNMIEYGGKEIEVVKLNVVIQSTRERFFFESFPRVPLGTVITVGDLTLTTDAESNDGTYANKWDYNPGELPPDLVWSEGQEVRVSLVLGSFPAEGTVTISGTAQVDQTLTADPSGITDTDGLTTATYTYQWLRVDADGVSNETNIGANAATYTPVAADVGKQIKVQVSFTDDRGHVETVTSDATVAVTGNDTGPALSIADASAVENAGHLLFDVTLSRSLRNTVKVDFETISGGTATEGVDYHARRTYTHVILAGDRTAQMGFALIEDMVAAAGETVKVRLSNARVVDAYGNKIKDLDITRAEATGTINAPTTTTTNVPGLTIRIKDATGDEDDGYLDFRVRLSRKHDDYVCYDFETISGGTATEGTDYFKIPKATYWMQIGKRVDKPFVRLIDDSVNDNGETVKVKISNARLCNDASQTLSITRAEATGTINNSDPMPLAWMVRFGRTVGSQVVDALGQRLDGGTASHVTVGGINLTGAPGAAPEAQSNDAFGLPEWAKGTQREESEQSFTANELLLGSAFHLSSGGGQSGGAAYTAWGRVARSGFEAELDDVTMDADVTSGLVGFDAEWERLLAGVMVSQSSGEGSYRLSGAENGTKAGTVESTLTGVYPYAQLELNAKVSAWALAGAGSGELTLHQDGGKPMPTDISMRMGAVGFKGKVLDGTGASKLAMNLKFDAMWVGTKSERTSDMVATQGDVTRLRVILEGERAFDMGGGATFTPSAEIGLRHDGGDAETGTGLEVGAGVSYVTGPLTVEGQVRMLVAHEESGYEEWGASGAIRITPSSSGRGLTLVIAPAWGRTGSTADRLWSAHDARALGADSKFEADSRIAIDTGYGFGLPHGRGVLTPYTGMTLGAVTRTMRTGARWQLSPDAVLGLEATRQTSDAGEADNQVRLRVALRF